MHCELLVLLGRIWSKKFSYLEVTLEGTEIARAGGAGDPREDAQEVLRGAARTRRTTAGKEKSACAREEKKVVGSGVDVR